MSSFAPPYKRAYGEGRAKEGRSTNQRKRKRKRRRKRKPAAAQLVVS